MITKIFEKIADRRYVILRSEKLLTGKINGDIDLIVHDIDQIVIDLEQINFSVFKRTKNSCKLVKYYEIEKEWILIDINKNFTVGNIKLSTELSGYLIDNHEEYRGVKILNRNIEGILLVIHKLFNKDIDVQNVKENIDLEIKIPLIVQEELKKNGLISNCDREMKVDKLVTELMKAKFKLSKTKSDKIQNLLKRLWRRCLFVRDNKIFALIGPDGSGKTAISSAMSKVKWPKTAVYYLGPISPMDNSTKIKRILNYLNTKKQLTENIFYAKIIRVVWNMLIFSYYLNIYISARYESSKGVSIIFDRYPLDMYIRSGKIFRKCLFYYVFPKPKKFILLNGDPVAIHTRKPELSTSEIKATYDLYEYTLSKKRLLKVDTTSEGIEQSVNAIYDIVK